MLVMELRALTEKYAVSGVSSSDRWHRLSRASFINAAVTIALLERVHLERRRPSDAVEFLARQKTNVQD